MIAPTSPIPNERTPELESFAPTLEAQTLYEDDTKTVALIVLRGLNKGVINHSSTTVYEVVAGEGRFHFLDEGYTMGVRDGSTIEVPVGTPYQDEGEMVMLATSTPPFIPEAVETLK